MGGPNLAQVVSMVRRLPTPSSRSRRHAWLICSHGEASACLVLPPVATVEYLEAARSLARSKIGRLK
jgi:hypothetical protein